MMMAMASGDDYESMVKRQRVHRAKGNGNGPT